MICSLIFSTNDSLAADTFENKVFKTMMSTIRDNSVSASTYCNKHRSFKTFLSFLQTNKSSQYGLDVSNQSLSATYERTIEFQKIFEKLKIRRATVIRLAQPTLMTSFSSKNTIDQLRSLFGNTQDRHKKGTF